MKSQQLAGLSHQVEQAAPQADLGAYHGQVRLSHRLLCEDHVLVGLRAELILLLGRVLVQFREVALTGYFIWPFQQSNAPNELADPLYYSTQGAELPRSRHIFFFLQKGSAQFGSMERSEATLSQLYSQPRSSLYLKLTGPSPSRRT